MKRQMSSLMKISVPGLALVLASLFFACASVQACTIFVLTDTNRALFCNSEDCNGVSPRMNLSP